MSFLLKSSKSKGLNMEMMKAGKVSVGGFYYIILLFIAVYTESIKFLFGQGGRNKFVCLFSKQEQ